MEKLNLESILVGPSDTELNQYRILQALKERREQFSQNRLFPCLAELIHFAGELEDLQSSREEMLRKLPGRLRDLDMENLQLVHEPAGGEAPELTRIMELVAWVLPRVRLVLEEGTGLYDFVENHINIEEVGIVPSYREEGYWFVPDPKGSVVHLLRYEISLFSDSKEKFRSLKTTEVDAIEEGAVRLPPETLKLDLIRKYRDLPNPATYVSEIDIDFPFAETLLPVAKRKFMAHICS
jgi:hypothetical protein